MSRASKDQLILAIDQGTTNSKAALISADGQMVSGGSASVGISSPHPGWVEQDPERIWSSVLEAAAGCLANAPDAEIAGVALSTQRESVRRLASEHRRTTRPDDRLARPSHGELVHPGNR